MNIGDYVRTKLGIAKLIGIDIVINEKEYQFDNPVSTYSSMFEFDYRYELDEEELKYIIIETNTNIKKIIKEHDIIKFYYMKERKGEVYKIEDELYVWNGFEDMPIQYIDIISVITKEQFESMEYKINE